MGNGVSGKGTALCSAAAIATVTILTRVILRKKSPVEKKKQIKTIIFDLDDTLWDNTPVLENANRAFFKHLHTKWPKLKDLCHPGNIGHLLRDCGMRHPHLDHCYGLKRYQMLTELALLVDDDIDPEYFAKTAVACFDDARNQVRAHLFEGALHLLQSLRDRGFNLVALTNGTVNISGFPEITQYFSHIHNAATIGFAKPHPQGFQKLMDLTHSLQDTTLAIGDSLSSDVECAKRTGVDIIWIFGSSNKKIRSKHAEALRDNTHGATHPVHSTRDILGVIDQYYITHPSLI